MSHIQRGGEKEMMHLGVIAQMTGTGVADWADADGPDSRCGVDFYYVYKSGRMFARVNDDQGHVTFSIFDEDGEDIEPLAR